MVKYRLVIGIFRDPDTGYVASCAAVSGLNGYGNTPEIACNDLQERLFGNLDDIRSLPNPEMELVSLHETEIEFSPFSQI
ncbi:hypothetical protein GALL_09380 [mine drainage metagenome]|uniref:HicB-like antitoxin of toxin-antitoxin system domain-containing protein n=1 Tax=mine drainage metagenome TaxID=410659 RepID=A0A1J5TCI0_9ZZZZ